MSKEVLHIKDISKTFPGVKALENVSFQLEEGEVHALMGENGAGKSTLMKILTGFYSPDVGGEIYFEGKKISFTDQAHALEMGIAMIHQELSPIPEMTIAENIFLGREPVYKKSFFVDNKQLNYMCEELLDEYKMELDPNTKMSRLSIAEKQMIEIIKAVSQDVKMIIMDEPTSALSNEEVDKLFNTIKGLRNKGIPVIYISHRMEEIFELADRVTILRDGKLVGTNSIKDITKDELIQMMVGRKLDNLYKKKKADIGNTVLEVKGLNSRGKFRNISFEVKAGEILGFAGLMGAGRSEVMRSIFGLDAYDSGTIKLESKQINVLKPKDAISKGIAMVTEDRKDYGVVLCRPIKENISLTSLNKVSKGFIIDSTQEKDMCEIYASKLDVKMRGLDQVVENLSGGNQQKVVLSKWLVTQPKVLILDEPTRGIDVGAKSEIYQLMSQLAGEGLAIVMVSSEMPEIIAMSDRIIVMGDGEIKGEFEGENVTQEEILDRALGGKEIAN